jgi:2-succinyl-6-hydroxy-2,4-cyclohexadiene-1-carboxylate synthase
MTSDRPAPLPVVQLQAAADSTGDTSVALVHGFTQNSHCWAPLDRLLAALGPVSAVDLPGHGAAPAPVGDIGAAGSELAASVTADLFIGYSMGGRVLLHAALAQPARIPALVLIGVHPGIESENDRGRRRREDDDRADRIEAEGLDAFLETWLSGPLFAELDEGAAHRAERLTNTDPDVAAALRLHGTGRQLPLWDRLGSLTQPVLLLAGQKDGRYRDLGARMRDLIGANASLEIVAGAGHAAHLERPAATAATITEWWRTVRP